MTLAKQDRGRLMNCLLEMGDLLLDCGAEIGRVEDTLRRMGHAYGAEHVNVFVIPSIISITMNFPDAEAVTQTQRIHSYGHTDFYRLEKLNAMSRQCAAEPIPLDELKERLDKVANGRKPFYMVFWGTVLGGGAFAVFFGGSLWDGLTAALFAAFICMVQIWLGKTQLGVVASNLMISLAVGLCVGVVTKLIPGLHMDKILIGDIMLLIPGLAITNAIRNTLVGNTISGVVRFAESLIWAAALAGGFMVALVLVDLLP